MISTWPYNRTVNSLTFISDLHLFSGRSNAAEHRELIGESIRAADLCVWGGDLFDFRWSRLRDGEESVGRALEWLDDWYTEFPETDFAFLNGNHDAHAPFAEALTTWSSKRQRFWCGLECLIVGDTLLLHGDVIEGKGTDYHFEQYRGRWREKRQAGTMAHRIYDVAIAARAHRAAAIAAHRRRTTCIRLIRWMHDQPTELVDGVRKIVFGHTHRRIDGFRLGGYQFFNGGAAIRHVPFCPVTIHPHVK